MKKHYRVGKINGREIFVIIGNERKTFIYKNMIFVALDMNELGGNETEAEKRLPSLKSRIMIEIKKQFHRKPWFNPRYWLDKYFSIPSYRDFLIQSELLIVL